MNKTIKTIKGKVVVEDVFDESVIVQLKKYHDNKVFEFWRINCNDLNPLISLINLEELNLFKTSIKDYSALGNCRNLKYLFLNGILKHECLDFLSELTHLQKLSLANLPKLRTFPNMSKCNQLATIQLWNCKNVTEISSLSTIPNLEEVVFVDTPQKPMDLVFLFNLKNIKYISAQFATKKLNNEFDKMLVEYNKHRYRTGALN